jgi:hypothetical protein
MSAFTVAGRFRMVHGASRCTRALSSQWLSTQAHTRWDSGRPATA